jgi:glycosyltransferase involved in cell wall biosynthesis
MKLERDTLQWHVLTGEYPPSCGGVGDYTAQLARALADAGDTVDVWVGGSVHPAMSSSYRVHALPDTFGPRSRATLSAAWDAAPGIVLLQYVPNALGRRGMNVGFCRWLADERAAGRDIRVMFHESYFYFSARRPWRNVAAIAQRVMAAVLVRAATQLYYSSANWHAYLAPYGAAETATVLPIPSTIPVGASPSAVDAFRRHFAPGARVVGHFGTFGEHVGDELFATLPALFERDGNVRAILIGRGSDRFARELARRVPASAERVHATGEIGPAEVAVALAACDVLFQPYPDGVTTRRTSVMAGIANGVATISTAGALTEPVWRETGAVTLVQQGDIDAAVAQIRRVLDDRQARATQARRGADVYALHFAMELTVARLRVATAVPVPA